MRAAVLILMLGVLAMSGCGQGTSTTTNSAGLRDMSALPAGLAGGPAPRIRLTDARGGSFDTASLAGRPYAVTFLYTTCPDVCPLIGEELRQALDDLGPRAAGVAVVAISVDPVNDSAAAVRTWLARHREPPNFHYLIGSERQLQPYWRAYFAAPQIPGDPQSSHTAAIWLVDAQGRRVGSMSAGGPVSPSDIAHNLMRLLQPS
jgi:protein SCO1